MTPEEQAVIDAAIECAQASDVMHNDDVLIALRVAVAGLEASYRLNLHWYLRTWADVRAGDRVRFSDVPDQPGTVTTIVADSGHVDPRSARTRNPIAREWSERLVTMQGVTGKLTFPLDGQIEIEMDVRVYEAMMILGGWENRIS